MDPFSLNIRGKLYEYTHPIVMGILNITPDSFYEGSTAQTHDAIKAKTAAMVADGADIIDVGACSSRPGCAFISEEEEIRRLTMGMKAVREAAPDIPVSVDTFRANVAKIAVEHLQADIINDISGGNFDDKMFETIAHLQVPYVLTHSRGTVSNMHEMTEYDDFTSDVIKDLAAKIAKLELLGVNDIIIDPGFGFSKTLEQNYILLVNLDAVLVFKMPVLVGVSRKSMITKLLCIDPTEAVNGTTVINTMALQKGVSILRVHDVKAAREAIKIYDTVHNL